MKKLVIAIVLCVFFISCHAQMKDSTYFKTDKLSIGAGLGLDFGAIGGCLDFYPHHAFGVFVSAGSVKHKTALNGGFRLRLANTSTFLRPYIVYMWGYNGLATDISGVSTSSYGPTLGLGVQTRMNPTGYGYFSFSVLLPKRSASFERLTGGTASDVLISFGYHLSLFSRTRTYKR